jgi:hypothetical protein
MFIIQLSETENVRSADGLCRYRPVKPGFRESTAFNETIRDNSANSGTYNPAASGLPWRRTTNKT